MKNKKLFIEALNTLMHSWGSDAPSEAHWTLGELMAWYEAEYGEPFEKIKEGLDESLQEDVDFLLDNDEDEDEDEDEEVVEVEQETVRAKVEEIKVKKPFWKFWA